MAGKARAVTYALRILWMGLGFHTATGIVRWIAGAHAPVTDTYELNLTGTWFTVLVFLAFENRGKVHRTIGLVVTPIAFLLLGYGYLSRGEPTPMGPAYQSPWLVVHVIFAWIAFSCYVISTGAAVLLLLKGSFPAWTPLSKVPNSEQLDVAGYRFIILGLINHAVMLVSGAFWAKKLWGYYWNWDALEIWSLVSFLMYALYLHARSFLGWRMRRAAWLAIAGLFVMVVSFWGVEWFAPSVHPGP